MTSFLSRIIILSLVLAFPALANHKWGVASDTLLFALPAIAGGKILSSEDQDGTNQLINTMASTLASSVAIKALAKSERPDHSGDDSFPSAHASLAFAVARFLDKRYGSADSRYEIYAYYTAASMASIARVKANKHRNQDILAGALLGLSLGNHFTQEKTQVSLSLSPLKDGVVFAWQSRL